MASWTDDPQLLSRFNPYVQQQPVEAMTQVGMRREEEFQTGVEKVQSIYNNLLGLAIAKPETQLYVKQKVGELNNAVKQSLQGDFSDSRLVNQIGGLAGKIASDPIVQNGVSSTAAIQSGFARMEEARKKGESSPNNERFFQKAVSDWQNDGDVTTSFSGTYSPHVDYIKRYTDLYKDTHPGENIPDDAFRLDRDETGKEVIKTNPVIMKGVSPEKLQNIWNLVASQPDVQNQLRIDGWAKYEGVNAQQIFQSSAIETNDALADMESSVNALTAKLNSGTGADAAAIGSKIDQLKRMIEFKKARFEDLHKALHTNPDAVKTQLMQESVGNSLISGFSYQTMEKSPLWEASNEERKFNLEFLKFKEEQRWHDLQYQTNLLRATNAGSKKGTKGSGGGGPSGDYFVTDYPVTTPSAQGEYTAMQDRDNAGKTYVQAQRKLANMIAGNGKSPYYLDANGQYVPNVGVGKDQYADVNAADRAAMNLLEQGKDQYINGKTTDTQLVNAFKSSERAYNDLQNKENIIKNVQAIAAPQLDRVKKALPQLNIPYGNTNITQSDFADVWMIKNDQTGGDAARNRLEAKFGKDGAYDVIQQSGAMVVASGGPDLLTTTSGKFQSQYQSVSNVMTKDVGLTSALSQINDEYRKRQQVEVGKNITYDAAKPEELASMANKFRAITDAMKAVNPESTSGDINDFENLLKPSDKEFKGYGFSSRFDKNNAYLTVSVGDKQKTITVPKSAYLSVFSDQQASSEFNDRFGSKLALNRFQYTGKGRNEAELVNMPRTSPYTVQYTLERNPDNSYSMRLWVTAKNSDDSIIPGMYAAGVVPGMPENLSEEDVLNWEKQLQDPNFIQQTLLYKQKLDELNKQ